MTPEYVHTSDEPKQLATQAQYDYFFLNFGIYSATTTSREIARTL